MSNPIEEIIVAAPPSDQIEEIIATTPPEDSRHALASIIISYRLLVGALLEHAAIGHEGHDEALSDFETFNYPAYGQASRILRIIIGAQKMDLARGEGLD